MFEKYNINDLFLGQVSVEYPDSDVWDVNVGSLFMSRMSGYGYITILRKVGEDTFIDLQDPKKPISKVRDSRVLCSTIEYMEPLSDYYNQNGEMKETFSRRQALKEGQKHYNEMHQKRLKLARNNNETIH